MILDMCFNLMSSTSSQDIQLCSSIEKDTAFKLIEISKEPLKLFWMRENREEGKSFQRMGLLLEGAYQWEMGFWLLFHFSGHFPKRIPQEFFKVPELGQFKIIKRFQLLVPKSQAKWFEFQVYKNCFWISYFINCILRDALHNMKYLLSNQSLLQPETCYICHIRYLN